MSTDLQPRQPAGVPDGGQFATIAHAEPSTSLPARPGHGRPDGPLQPRVFDIDGQFGPLAGYDDGRRWNGFACPWLTRESLERVKAATRDWAEVDPEVEWLDDAPDGVWRLHTGDGEPAVDLEVAAVPGPAGEVLFRLEGWCWDALETADVELE